MQEQLTALLQTVPYKEYKTHLKPYVDLVKQEQINIYEPICNSIAKQLQIKAQVPTLQTLRLAKECVDLGNLKFNLIFQQICMPIYEELGEFRKNDRTLDRGKYYFSDYPDTDQSKYGKSCFILILESIFVWARQFPFNGAQSSKFYQVYASLKLKNVVFPELQLFSYYKQEEVLKVQHPEFQEPQASKVFGSIPIGHSVKLDGQQGSKHVIEPQQPKQGRVSLEQQKKIHQQFDAVKKELQTSLIKTNNIKELVFKQIQEQLRSLKASIDKFLDELLQENAEFCSMEVAGVMDDVNQMLEDISLTMDNKMAIDELRIKYIPNYKKYQASQQQKQGAFQYREQLQPINESNSEETESKQQSYAPKRYESVSMQYDVEQMRKDYESQIQKIQKQHEDIIASKERESKERLYQLKNENQQLEKKNKEMEVQLHESIQRQEISDKFIKSQKLQQSKSSIESVHEMNQLKQKIDDLQQQNKQMKETIQKIEIQHSKENQIQKAQFRQEFVTQQKQASQLVHATDNELIQQIQHLQQLVENNKLQEILNSQTLLQEIQQIRNLNDQLHQQIQEKQNLLNSQSLEIKNQQEIIAMQKESTKKINEELLKITQNIVTTNPKLDEILQQKYNEAIEKQKEQIKTIKELRSELSQSQMELEKLKFQLERLQLKEQEKEYEKEQEKEQLVHEDDQQQLESNLQTNTQQQTFRITANFQPQLSDIPSQHSIAPTNNQLQTIFTDKPFLSYQAFQGSINLQNTNQQTIQNMQIIKQINDKTHFFPYQTPQEYYQFKQENPQKGVQVDFTNIYPLLSQENKIFKQTIICNNYQSDNLIYNDDPQLMIGIAHLLQQNESMPFVTGALYYSTNVNSIQIDSKITKQMSHFWCSGNPISEKLEKKQQIKQELAFPYDINSFEPIQIELKYSNKFKKVYIPNPQILEISYKKQDPSTFQRRWKHLHIIRSDKFNYDTELIQDYKNLLKLNEAFQILNPTKIEDYEIGIDELKIGCAIKLQHQDKSSLLKIEFIPNNKMIIFIGFGKKEKQELFSHILNNYQAIFMK